MDGYETFYGRLISEANLLKGIRAPWVGIRQSCTGYGDWRGTTMEWMTEHLWPRVSFVQTAGTCQMCFGRRPS